jgi:hypothetical protein
MKIPSSSTPKPDVPVDADLVGRQAFRQHAKKRRELQSIFDPIAEIIADRMVRLVAEQGEEIRGQLDQVPHYEIPYDVPYESLPPGFFEGVDQELGLLDSDLHPPWVDRIDDVGDHYCKNLGGKGTDYEKSIGDQLAAKVWRLRDGTVDLRKLYAEFNFSNWKKYESAYRAMRERGQERWLYELNGMRVRNGKNRYDAPARYNKFLFPYAAANNTSIFKNIVVPVGAYGETFAQELSKATVFTLETIANTNSDEIQQAINKHGNVLRTHTARGHDQDGGPNSHSTKLTLQEGAVSITQTVVMLTASKVHGYGDPQRLFHDLVRQGFIEKVTRMIPMGLVAPIALHGDYFPKPVEKRDGKLRFSGEFTDWLLGAQAKYRGLLAREKLSAATGYGLTCPAAGSGGGVRKLSEAMLAVYDLVAQDMPPVQRGYQ